MPYLSIKNPKASRALKRALDPARRMLASLARLRFATSATFGLRSWGPPLDQILDPHLSNTPTSQLHTSPSGSWAPRNTTISPLDFIGIWNEHPYDVNYIVTLRNYLDMNNLQHVRIVAPDGSWNIAEDVSSNSTLKKSYVCHWCTLSRYQIHSSSC